MKLKSLDYVVLIVDDLDRAQQFYIETLGLPLKHRSGDYVQIAAGETRLGLFTREAMADVLGRPLDGSSGPSKFELGFKVDDCDTVYAELIAAGVATVTAPQTRPWGQRTAYVEDPDGNLIELVQD
jgi:lactoylglutathione lyase